jgi:hypothetical protein
MSKKAYEAAIQRLRGEALTAMSVIDGILSSHSPDPNAVELIIEQTEKMARKVSTESQEECQEK